MTQVEPTSPAGALSHKTLNRDPLTGTFKRVAITHAQAFEIYCELPDMSLRAFARALNERSIKISYALVGRWSAKHKWQHRRAALRDEGPVGLLTAQDRIARLAAMSDQCKRETVNGLLVQIMETVSGNLGQIEIRTTEDAHAMVDLAQKLVELRGDIEPEPRDNDRSAGLLPRFEDFKPSVIKNGRVIRKADQEPISIGSFRDQVVAGGEVPD
jgi:hypothetical protein